MYCYLGIPEPTAVVWTHISQFEKLMDDNGKPKSSLNAIYIIVSKNYYNIKELLGIIPQS